MKKLLMIPVLFLIIQGCKEDETPDANTAKTKTELLTSAPWRMTAIKIDPALDIGGTQVTDFFSQMDDCDKDDLTKYDANKTGVYDEGATKCDPTDPQTSTFTWTWDLTETKITEDGETYDVDELTESILKFSIILDGDDIGGISGLNYKLTATSVH